MKKRYWRDALWFAAGTFFGGWVLGLLVGLLRGGRSRMGG